MGEAGAEGGNQVLEGKFPRRKKIGIKDTG